MQHWCLDHADGTCSWTHNTHVHTHTHTHMSSHTHTHTHYCLPLSHLNAHHGDEYKQFLKAMQKRKSIMKQNQNTYNEKHIKFCLHLLINASFFHLAIIATMCIHVGLSVHILQGKTHTNTHTQTHTHTHTHTYSVWQKIWNLQLPYKQKTKYKHI